MAGATTYHVVVCPESDCHNVWIVKDNPKTTTCRTCGTRHSMKQLKFFIETTDRDEAVDVRSEKVAELQGAKHIYDGLVEEGKFDDDPGRAITDEEWLEQNGIDSDEVATVSERSGRSSRSRSQKDIVLDSLTELDAPTKADVVAYATDNGVPEAKVEKLLSRLRSRGELMESEDGTLRSL